MMVIAVDSNILLDVLGNDPEFYNQSSNLLQVYQAQSTLIISPLVYSELFVFFLEKHKTKEHAVKELGSFLHDFGIEVINLSKADAHDAASACLSFLRTKKEGMHCLSCGSANRILCSTCKKEIKWRNHIITDFLIGAHAQNNADVFLTRDRGFYKKYFKVRVVESNHA